MLALLAQAAQKTVTWDSGKPLLPLWLGVSLAIVALIATAAHMHSLKDADVPLSRRRIRMINGWIMIVLAPVAAWAFSMAIPAHQREFILALSLVVFLLGLVIILACVDALNNLRLHRSQQAVLRDEIALLRAEAARREKGGDQPQ